MGACASKPRDCLCFTNRKKRKKKSSKKRGSIVKRRVSSRKFDNGEFRDSANRSRPSSVIQGSLDSAWFDTASVLESELDDDFYSLHDDSYSLNSCESISRLSISSPKDFGHVNNNESRGLPVGDSVRNMNAATAQANGVASELKPKDTKAPVLVDGISNGDAKGDATQPWNHCGLISNACLPCIPSTTPTVERKRSLSPGTPSSRKRASMRLSFKRREGHASSGLVSPRVPQQRPIAGSLVSLCPIEKKMSDSWSHIEPSTFKVRGQNYVRDKKKEFAPNCAAFYPFGVDVFSSQRKIDHIARFVQLPLLNTSEEIPSILVVNVQVPLYPPAIFQSENDGEGINLVLYFKLSETYSKELPVHFQENITKLINDEVERVRSFPVDTISPFRERLKIFGRVANLEDLHLSTAEKKLMNAYNEKPVLSRPQHEFFLGEHYVEIDLDLHRFSYISRKGFEAFQDRYKQCVVDFGLTIQGNKTEELPENMLCCIRLNEIDYTNYPQLGL